MTTRPFPLLFAPPLLLALLVNACGEKASQGDPDGGKAGGPAAYLPPIGGSSLGSGGASGGPGASGNAPGGSGALAGGTNPGSGGTSSGGASSGGTSSAGTSSLPQGAVTGFSVTTQDLAVPMGTVFNVAENYFNDGLIPPTPVANFGLHSQIITVAADDGSLDIAWLDYAAGKGKPWSVTTPSMIYLTHVDAALGTATTVASGISSYKLLGFAKDAAGASYLAYNKDHALKTNAQNDPNNINGNELHVAKLTGTNLDWDQLIFGDQDNKAEASLGDPGGAASGVLGYDPMNQKLVLYVGHSMMWMPTRHQAGFLRLLNPGTGAVQPPSGNDIIHFGAGWWYSHNFNQRLLIDDGKYYVLAHGDAYARQLGFGRWSVESYAGKNQTDFDQSYWDIAGNEGDNKTDAQTGQLVRMPDGRFLIVHTSSQTRGARDVRLVFADGETGVAAGDSALWLTTNQGTTHATMPKLELIGDGHAVLVTYALWDSTKGHQLTWYGALLSETLETLAAPKVLPDVEFVDSAPLFQFKAGPHAGAVGWVSGNAAHSLSVHVASPSAD